MRIGISGSHATGKSTLVEELSARLVGYETIEEAYHLMAADGETFSAPPIDVEYESMIERSIRELALNHSPNVVFDRTPLDYLAYLAVARRDVRNTFDEWLPSVREALTRIDAIIFVPIEDPDRVTTSVIELPKLRKRVDALLREVLVEDAWRLGIPVFEAQGSAAKRATDVLQWMRRLASSGGSRLGLRNGGC